LPPPRPNNAGAASPVVSKAEAREDDDDEDANACFERIVQLGTQVKPAPAIENGACGVKHPLLVARLPNGLALSPPAIVVCPVAEALARWSIEVVATEAERHLATTATKILIGTSYECRGQNRQTGAKLSEHAFANAVDVMGFEFTKRPSIAVTLHAEGSGEDRFQTAVRQGACRYFTTVLGPGSDAAHANHLHLDLRGRKGAYRMCQ
jgi:hypothetical protein